MNHFQAATEDPELTQSSKNGNQVENGVSSLLTLDVIKR